MRLAIRDEWTHLVRWDWLVMMPFLVCVDERQALSTKSSLLYKSGQLHISKYVRAY